MYLYLHTYMGFPGGSDGKESACNAGDLGSITGLGDPLEKGMATHYSILARRIPWTVEPGRLQSMRPQRVGATEQLTHTHTHTHIYTHINTYLYIYTTFC